MFNVTAAADQTPYNASAFAIPGTIEAEEYDKGGEGIAYHDAIATNEGDASVRTTEGVDIIVCSTGGYAIGYTNSGEWVEYSVNVASSGLYDIQYAVASGNSGTFHLEMDNADITGTLTVATNGFQNWQTLKKQQVPLTEGAHILKFSPQLGNVNLDKLTFVKNIATGVDAMVASEIATIYPNPSANGIFTINTAQSGTLTITDLTCNLVYSEFVNNPTAIDLSSAQGVYIALFSTEGKTYRYKLMVNK